MFLRAAVLLAMLLVPASASGAPVRGLVPDGEYRAPVRFGPLAADAGAGTLVALDAVGRDVLVMDAEGRLLRRWATQPSLPAAADWGAGIAVGPGGEVAIARGAAGEVERYTREGVLIKRVRAEGVDHPYAVGYSPDGALVIRSIDRITRIEPDGRRRWGVVAAGNSLAADAGARAWAAHPIGLARFDGRQVTALSGQEEGYYRPWAPGRLRGVRDVFVADGAAWVLDGSLQRFNGRGQVRLACEIPGTQGAVLAPYLFTTYDEILVRWRMSSEPAGPCTEPPLRLKLRDFDAPPGRRLGAARVRVRLSHPARLELSLYRQFEKAGELVKVAGPDHVAVPAGTTSIRPSRVHAGRLAPGRYRLRVAAIERGSLKDPLDRADAPLLRFRVS